jgi:prepilin signal peptidase PulO-like enzyme (type II secretory pathway)
MIHNYILLFALGLIMGSFLNAWEWRLSVGKNVAKGRSMCPKCEHQLAWYDNIPAVSFLLLRGACRHCKAKISWQYPVVEIVTGLLFVFVFCFHGVQGLGTGDWVLVIRDLFITYFLLAVFLYDLKHQLIYDRMTLLPAGILFVYYLVTNHQSLVSMLLGVIIGGGFFLAQYLVSNGKWIGGGDIRLGVFMGVILGWPLILVALFLAYIIGAGVSVPLLLLKKKSFASKVPFGTYLVVGTFIAMFWGRELLDWYIGLI